MHSLVHIKIQQLLENLKPLSLEDFDQNGLTAREITATLDIKKEMNNISRTLDGYVEVLEKYRQAGNCRLQIDSKRYIEAEREKIRAACHIHEADCIGLPRPAKGSAT